MCRIDRNEAVERLKKLEASARDEREALCYVRAYNAIMSCRVIPKGRRKPDEGGPKGSRDK